jgi:hypothetical protein
VFLILGTGNIITESPDQKIRRSPAKAFSNAFRRTLYRTTLSSQSQGDCPPYQQCDAALGALLQRSIRHGVGTRIAPKHERMCSGLSAALGKHLTTQISSKSPTPITEKMDIG